MEASEQFVILGSTVVFVSDDKIVGILLESKLNYKAQIARALQKEVNAELALKRLKNLHPKTAQRLFQAKIVLVVDDASPIWLPSLSIALINRLNFPQKIEGKAFITAFCTVSLTVAKSKIGLESLFV